MGSDDRGRCEKFQFKKILVPLDGSPLAQQAVKPAVAVARAMSAELLLLRVVAPARWMGDSIEIAHWSSESTARQRAEAEIYLKGLRAELRDPQVPITVKTMSGPLVASIIDCAEDHEVDLIVMAGRRRSGIRRWLRGSIADEVIHSAPCATLLIQPEGCSRRSPLPARNSAGKVVAPLQEANPDPSIRA